MKTIYAEELGTPLAVKGRYQAHAERGIFRIFIISEEIDLNDAGELIKTGKMEAIPAGYISSLENFENGIDAIEEEMRCLAAS